MSKVDVVIIPDDGNTELVKSYFTDPLFNVIPAPSIDNNLTSKDEQEITLVKTILSNATRHIIIIKDSSMSNLTPAQIASYIKEAMTFSVDLYYLSRWGDKCQISKEVSNRFIRTYAPHGFQAIMFYPDSIAKIVRELNAQTVEAILYSLIYNGIIKAICNPQNIVYYNAFLYANNNDQFARLNECTTNSTIDYTNDTNKYLYIGGILILIFLVAWGMRKMGPVSKSNDKKEDDLVKTLTTSQ